MPHPVLLMARERRPPPPPPLPPPSRVQRFEDAFPTVIRYVGLGMTVVLITATIIISVTSGIAAAAALAPGYVAAAGMILYKSVHDGARGGGHE